jgi:hypothetical protein
MRYVAITTLAATLVSGPLHAQTAVRHIEGYRCMMLNITERESMDPNFRVVVRSAPSPGAPEAGWSAAIVIVKEPVVPRNGFLEMLRADGRTAWISATVVKPYRPVADPNARCFPAILSNGRVGTTSH